MMFILGLATSILPASAQLAAVEGVVFNAPTEKKIAGARVSLCDRDAAANAHQAESTGYTAPQNSASR